MRALLHVMIKLFVDASQGKTWALAVLGGLTVVIVASTIAERAKNEQAAEDELFGTTDRGHFPDPNSQE